MGYRRTVARVSLLRILAQVVVLGVAIDAYHHLLRSEHDGPLVRGGAQRTFEPDELGCTGRPWLRNNETALPIHLPSTPGAAVDAPVRERPSNVLARGNPASSRRVGARSTTRRFP